MLRCVGSCSGGSCSGGREDHYDVVRPIGSGSFGQVFLVLHRRERRHYVMKSIELKSTTLEGREAAELEVRLLSAMRHPNIVSYRESFVNAAGHLCIFMEYCEHGDVFTYLQEAKKAGKVPDESRLLEWFIQLSLALHALHFKKILHRDLKTQNIFLTGNKDQNMFALKLGDFGIATVLNSTLELAKTQIGTPFYMSPELINNKPYSYKSDIWGLGCVLYEIINGQRAFDAQGLNGLALKIIKGHYTPITSNCSAATRSLIKSMLNRNPKNRPTLKEILHLSSIRPRIPIAQRNVINAGPPEARTGIEQALNNQLATLGLGGLVNCPGAGPKRDRGRVLQLLEKAKQRKRREEEELHRTAALLAQCLGGFPPGHGPADHDVCGNVGAPMRDSAFWHPQYSSLELSLSDTPHEDSQEETMIPGLSPMSHRDRVLMEKERRREEAQRREELELRRIREDNLAHQRARAHDSKPSGHWGGAGPGSPSETAAGGAGPAVPSPTAAPKGRRSRRPTKEAVGPGSPASARGLSEHSSVERRHQELSDGRRPNAVRTPRRRRTRTITTEPCPPAQQYGEPLPPHELPRGSGGKHYALRSGDVSRAALPARQPMHSVCLEALDAPETPSGASDRERLWCSDDSYGSSSLSEVEEWDAVTAASWSNAEHRRQRSLQQKIDQCRAAIYRHKMTIAMLQYSAAQEQECEPLSDHLLPRAEAGGGSAYAGCADEGASLGLQPTASAFHPALAGRSQYPAEGSSMSGAPAFVQDFTARLQRRCLEGLGLEKFRAARRCLRSALDAAAAPGSVRDEMLELLGIDKIGFLSLLDQIVHMERRWGAQEAT